MMGNKERSFQPLLEVTLEDLVTQDHFYRHLHSKGIVNLRRFRTFALHQVGSKIVVSRH